MVSRFDNVTVLVTGAAQGMGAAHVDAFHREGACVVATDIAPPNVSGHVGDRRIWIELDVTNESAWAAAVATTEERFGPIGVLVNNAGIIESSSSFIELSSPSDWEIVLRVNLIGQYLGIRAVVPSMRRAGGGSIINVSSVAGFRAGAGFSAYVSSKFAIRGLTQTAAAELGRDAIRVNCIHPGYVETHMGTRHQRVKSPTSVPPYADFAIPRLADPHEISELVMYLASEQSSFSTGSEFVVDGGLLLGSAAKY